MAVSCTTRLDEAYIHLEVNMVGRKVSILPADFGSLSVALPPAPPGTIFVKGPYGGRSVAADAGFETFFGRNVEDVQVSIGCTDTSVSRRQGVITRQGGRWMVQNLGQRPIRLPGDGGRLLLQGHKAQVPAGFAPLIIMSTEQEHVLEVRIAAGHPAPPSPVTPANFSAPTYSPDARDLDDEERLVLVCLAQSYLRNDPRPQPLPWTQVAFELSELRPAEKWDWRKAARIVARVRKHLSETYHVTGIMEEKDSPSIGTTINHNLITDLLLTGTLVPENLDILADG